MNIPFITHPRTNQADPMLTMACIVVAICGIKFLFEGININILGHIVNLGHADAMTYGAVLTPVLGAHATREWRIPNSGSYGPNVGISQVQSTGYAQPYSSAAPSSCPIVNPINTIQKVDNPDAR